MLRSMYWKDTSWATAAPVGWTDGSTELYTNDSVTLEGLALAGDVGAASYVSVAAADSDGVAVESESEYVESDPSVVVSELERYTVVGA